MSPVLNELAEELEKTSPAVVFTFLGLIGFTGILLAIFSW